MKNPSEEMFFELMAKRGIRLTRQPLLRAKVSSKSFGNYVCKYRPDFHDPNENVYYEVIGTRQAYYQNREKIKKFLGLRPDIVLKYVNPDGTEYYSKKISANVQSRTKIMGIRLTPIEWKAIQSAATNKDMLPSEFVRELIKSHLI